MAKSNTLVMNRWLEFNIRGIGIHKSTRNAKYSYNGPIYYSNGWPIARLAKLPDGNWACLHKHYVHPSNIIGWTVDGGPRLAVNLSVPDIAAFSSYEGDWLDDAGMQERLHSLWKRIAAYQVDLAREVAFPTLVSPGSSSGGLQASLIGNVSDAASEYEAYSKAFKLGWPRFPTVYMTSLRQVIEDRKRHYYSKAEIDKRERAAARAGAKKALGLDNKEK